MAKLTKRQQAHEQLKQALIKRTGSFDRYVIYNEVEPSLNINDINNLIASIELIPKDESLFLCFKRDYYGKVCSWFTEKNINHIRVRTSILINKEVE